MATNQSTSSNPAVEYRDIPNFPGYRAGTDGTIWTSRRRGSGKTGWDWRRLKLKPAKCGRLKVNLCDGKGGVFTKFVHHLILTAFVGPCPAGHEACHFPDRNVTNNHLENLRWDTPTSNTKDKIVHDTIPYGTRMPSAKLTEEKVRIIRAKHESGKLDKKLLARKFGVTETLIRRVVARQCWKHVS